MDRVDIQELAAALAKATAEWLAEKASLGFEQSLFAEALLMVPVGEFFIRHHGADRWKLQGEWYDVNDAKHGTINFDLLAESKGQRLLVEFKYLKKQNDSRLLKDFVKLAPPRHEDYSRLLLVAEYTIGRIGYQSKSALINEICAAGGKIEFQVCNEGNVPSVSSGLKAKHSLYADDAKDVGRIVRDHAVSRFTAEEAGSHRTSGQFVSVFSIGRVLTTG
ncbi:hypothetical protein QA649_02435 [Bradyrhizobium sp. CB1717]|uniref:hypothetical protein n=1 Tax=Bradyrhizobium sp. CB1717 TaxID=3039154 RepID=UPI0024B0ECB8|nr:hypothetical protein [Bradyrhizobium sp. CB1717]WFU25127.1 hypothetical protein QA649_02435 [Bradyrhizobium sp. CB1717]